MQTFINAYRLPSVTQAWKRHYTISLHEIDFVFQLIFTLILSCKLYKMKKEKKKRERERLK